MTESGPKEIYIKKRINNNNNTNINCLLGLFRVQKNNKGKPTDSELNSCGHFSCIITATQNDLWRKIKTKFILAAEK